MAGGRPVVALLEAIANSKGFLVPQLEHFHLHRGTGWKAATAPAPWVEQGALPHPFVKPMLFYSWG